MRLLRAILVGWLGLAVGVGICAAEEPASRIRLDVKEFKLKNGMQFLIVERPTTPQVACRVAIRGVPPLKRRARQALRICSST